MLLQKRALAYIDPNRRQEEHETGLVITKLKAEIVQY